MSANKQLPEGEHRVVVTNITVADESKVVGPYIVISMLLDGLEYKHPFFVSGRGWAGTFEQQRAQSFVNVGFQSAGVSTRWTPEQSLEPGWRPVAEHLQQIRGAEVHAFVRRSMMKVRVDRHGKPVLDVTFSVIDQPRSEVLRRRAELCWSLEEAYWALRPQDKFAQWVCEFAHEELTMLAPGLERRALVELVDGPAWMSLFQVVTARLEAP